MKFSLIIVFLRGKYPNGTLCFIIIIYNIAYYALIRVVLVTGLPVQIAESFNGNDGNYVAPKNKSPGLDENLAIDSVAHFKHGPIRTRPSRIVHETQMVVARLRIFRKG